jgi:putative membrane protein
VIELVPLVLTAAAAAGYLTGIVRLRRRGDRWPLGRVVALVAGTACVAVAVLPPIADHDESFPVHVVQHLLLGMAGPALLVLSAPVTLLLRTCSIRSRRRVLRVLHSRAAAVVVAPATAVVISLGGLAALYLTGLYARTLDDELLHAAVHLHFFLAGALLSWVVVGIDPMRFRPGVGARVATLITAGAGHDVVAKLLYARGLPAGGGAPGARRLGAELMYYGGTVIDLALAVVVMAQWWRVSGRALAREARPRSAHAQPGKTSA